MPERLRGVFVMRHYTDPCSPLPIPNGLQRHITSHHQSSFVVSSTRTFSGSAFSDFISLLFCLRSDSVLLLPVNVAW